MAVDLEKKLADAERRAVVSLARRKYIMFGYWAAIWVHLNALSPTKKKMSPFRDFVNLARERLAKWD